jgi:nucleotide-binding universal stress UspA family protein
MSFLKKILLPVDYSLRSLEAAQCAIPLARHFASELTLLNVFSPNYCVSMPEGGAMLSSLLVDWRAQARQQLDSFLGDDLRDFHVSRVLLNGDPAEEIVKWAHLEKVDLIMMATHGYGPFRRLLLGSVVAKVLHDAYSPVWTAVHLQDDPSAKRGDPRHIVCAIDCGRQSEAALDGAYRLATEFKARMTVVHAITSLDPRTESYYFSPEWRKHIFDERMAGIKDLLKRFKIEAEIKLVLGEAHKGVCMAANQLHADLLVINRGSSTDNGGRLRSNAYAIIRESPCPVVSV